MRDLQPDDSRPPYLQLAAVIRDAIGAGEFQPGARLPTRAELHARYGFAGATINSAMRLLAEEGLVVPQQGKGVFVHSKPTVEPLDVAAEIADLKARVARLEQRGRGK